MSEPSLDNSPPIPPPADSIEPVLDLSRWREYDDLITDSLWLLGARDRSSTHSNEYWGAFVPQIPNQVVRRFTAPREVVLDLFSGLGATLIECRGLGRHSVGVELIPSTAERSRDILRRTADPFGVEARIVVGDSTTSKTSELVRETLHTLGDGFADCVILHPPYHDIIKFSDDPRDLSNAPTHAAFLDGFRAAVGHAVELLRPGRRLALVIGDRYARGEWVPLGFECMQVCRDAGLLLKAINVKDVQGNERGKGVNTNLWRYRALKQGLYVFKHEYVMLFEKPTSSRRDSTPAT